MNCKELKWHIRNGLIRGEYFYIPLHRQNNNAVYLKFNYDTGGDIYISEVRLIYYTYQLVHDFIYDESGGITGVKTDEYPKGYAFETDLEWRFPVPDPSQWEIYPVPDLTQYNISVPGGTVTKTSAEITVTFSTPKTLVEIQGLPAGIYTVSPTAPASVRSWTYYPDYYNNYYNPRRPDHSAGLGMIDRNGRFSGYNLASVSEADGNGYAVSCATVKFTDNIMPIVGEKNSRVRWVVCYADIPGFTGVRMPTNITHNWTNYAIKGQGWNGDLTVGVCRGLECVNDYYMGGRCLGAKIYEDDVYKGFIMFNLITQTQTQLERNVTVESGRVQHYGITEIQHNASELVPAFYRFSCIYSDGGKTGRTHTGSYYLDVTETDLENLTNGRRQNIHEWAEGCASNRLNELYAKMQDYPDYSSGYSFSRDDYIYEDEYYQESWCSLVSASKSGSSINIVWNHGETYYQSGYLVNLGVRYPGYTDIEDLDKTVGGNVWGRVSYPYDYQQSASISQSGLSYNMRYDVWNGIPDNPDGTTSYCYIEGMTKEEALGYITMLSRSGTTVETEEG